MFKVLESLKSIYTKKIPLELSWMKCRDADCKGAGKFYKALIKSKRLS